MELGRRINTGIKIISLCLILGGCAFGLNLENYESPRMTISEAWEKTASFTYIPETGEYWKSPKEFERDGGGDCEDFVIYMAYLIGRGDMACLECVIDGKTRRHAALYIDGEILDAQAVKYKIKLLEYDERFMATFKLSAIISYDTLMSYATSGGLRGAQRHGYETD